jgi:hypothetical protein
MIVVFWLACLLSCTRSLAIGRGVAKLSDQDIREYCKPVQSDSDEADDVAAATQQQPQTALTFPRYWENFRNRSTAGKAVLQNGFLAEGDEECTPTASRKAWSPKGFDYFIRGDRKGLKQEFCPDPIPFRSPVPWPDDLRSREEFSPTEDTEQLSIDDHYEREPTLDLHDDCLAEHDSRRGRGHGRSRSQRRSSRDKQGDLRYDRNPLNPSVAPRVELTVEHADGRSERSPIEKFSSHSYKSGRAQKYKKTGRPRRWPDSNYIPEESLFASDKDVERPFPYLFHDTVAGWRSDRGSIQKHGEAYSMFSNVADPVLSEQVWPTSPSKANDQLLTEEQIWPSFVTREDEEALKGYWDGLPSTSTPYAWPNLDSRSHQETPSQCAIQTPSVKNDRQWSQRADPSGRGRAGRKKRGRRGRGRGAW